MSKTTGTGTQSPALQRGGVCRLRLPEVLRPDRISEP